MAQIYFPTFIRQLGTQKPYHETCVFWTNPDTIINTKDLEALYGAGTFELTPSLTHLNAD